MKKSNAQLERERKEKEYREWLRTEQSKPRTPLTAQYGESINVHKRVYDGIMKQVGKKITISSSKVVGGEGGTYILEYTTTHGARGTLELFALGPMPKG